MTLLALPASAQLTDNDLAELRAQGDREGWTFTVGRNSATRYPLETLCGLVPPKDLRQHAKRATAPVIAAPSADDLPTSYDLRTMNALTPVRNQGGCGSCWAFGTIGPLESAIKRATGSDVDLSEQWLVSCNTYDFSCAGGWFAHEFHQFESDLCGGFGAVLEADFPYVASTVACGCPYDHHYWIDGWGYVDAPNDIAPAAAIKQAIVDHGAVATAITVGSAFYGYTGGVYNADYTGVVNHAVVIVGWDDSLGAEGVWIIRNSWGSGWGDGGYMLIEYGKSKVGFGANYIEYSGSDIFFIPPYDFESARRPGEPAYPVSQVYTLVNSGETTRAFTASADTSWLDLSTTSGALAPGGEADIIALVNAEADALSTGTYIGYLVFDAGAGGVSTRTTTLTVGPTLAPAIHWFPLDTDPGWTREGQWAFGVPTGGGSHGGDPTAGFTGSNVFGYNLSGDYEGGLSPKYLTTPPLDCSGYENLTLTFRRWLGVEGSDFDHAAVEVRAGASGWTRLWSDGAESLSDRYWVECEYDISSIADGQSDVQVRWVMGPSDSSLNFPGWNLDDIALRGEASAPEPTAPIPGWRLY